MFMVAAAMIFSLMNMQYTDTEAYKKCISEDSQSSYCEDKIFEYNQNIKAFEEIEQNEAQLGG